MPNLKKEYNKLLKRAKEFSGSFLVSETLEIDNTIEPYAFFAGGKKLYGGERFFWKDPSGTQMFSGLGICKLIHSPGDADRFFHVEKKWRDAVKHVIRIGVQEIKGTGRSCLAVFLLILKRADKIVVRILPCPFANS